MVEDLSITSILASCSAVLIHNQYVCRLKGLRLNVGKEFNKSQAKSVGISETTVSEHVFLTDFVTDSN